MTEPKPDWADEEARKLMFCMTPTRIAAALRKAKADGVRLVIDEIIKEAGSVADWKIDYLTALADHIEKGE